MATGYTEIIGRKKGLTFEEFAWRCVRAMGVTITMRDDGLDVPVPKNFEVDTGYYEKSCDEAEAALDAAEKLTKAEAMKASRKRYLYEVKYHTDALNQQDATELRYWRMLERVRNWNAPTSEHVGFKKFMTDQIVESIKWDSSDYHSKRLKELLKSGPQPWRQYKADAIYDAQAALARAQESISEEIDRTATRNNWLADLRATIPQPEGPQDGGIPWDTKQTLTEYCQTDLGPGNQPGFVGVTKQRKRRTDDDKARDSVMKQAIRLCTKLV